MSEVRVSTRPANVVGWVLAVITMFVVIGWAVWAAGVHEAGTAIMLISFTVAVTGFAALGVTIAAGLPRPTPFAERSLLTARLAWIGRTLWAAALIAVGGYFGAIIAADLANPSLNTPDRVRSYFVFIVVMLLVLAAWGIVLPIAIVTGIDIIRAGPDRRRAAMRGVLSERTLSDAWVDHLTHDAYAWATLAARVLLVPLAAAVFWGTATSGLWS